MDKFKIKLDRPKPSSEEIAQKQDFEAAYSQFKQASGFLGMGKGVWYALALVAAVAGGLTYGFWPEADAVVADQSEQGTQVVTQTPVVEEGVEPTPGEIDAVRMHDFQLGSKGETNLRLAEGWKVGIEAEYTGDVYLWDNEQARTDFLTTPWTTLYPTSVKEVWWIDRTVEFYEKQATNKSSTPIHIDLGKPAGHQRFFWRSTGTNEPRELIPNATSGEQVAGRVFSLDYVRDSILNALPRVPSAQGEFVQLRFDERQFPELKPYKNLRFEVATDYVQAAQAMKQVGGAWYPQNLQRKGNGNTYSIEFKKLDTIIPLEVYPVMEAAAHQQKLDSLMAIVPQPKAVPTAEPAVSNAFDLETNGALFWAQKDDLSHLDWMQVTFADAGGQSLQAKSLWLVSDKGHLPLNPKDRVPVLATDNSYYLLSTPQGKWYRTEQSTKPADGQLVFSAFQSSVSP